MWLKHFYTPRFNEVERGVYWYHLVRLSVRPSDILVQAPSRAGFCTGNWSSLSLPVQTCNDVVGLFILKDVRQSLEYPCALRVPRTSPHGRVVFLPEEMYFFQDTQRKLEDSYFFQFLPEEIGRYWKNYTFFYWMFWICCLKYSIRGIWLIAPKIVGIGIFKTVLRWQLEFCIYSMFKVKHIWWGTTSSSASFSLSDTCKTAHDK